MSSHDPYAPPASDLSGRPAPAQGGPGPSARVVQFLSETKPWVRVFGVLLFVGAGFMVLGGLSMMAVGAIGAFATADSELGPWGGVGGGLIGLLYLVMAFIYVPPALYLWRYGTAIQGLKDGGGNSALEEALRHQKSFWKFVGIAALVMILLMPAVAIVGGVVAAVVGAAAG